MKATRDNSVKNLYPLLCKGKNNTRKAAPWLLSSEVPQMMFVTIMVESFVHECLRIIEKKQKSRNISAGDRQSKAKATGNKSACGQCRLSPHYADYCS